MPDNNSSSHMALDQRVARFEQMLQAVARRIGQIPLRYWQAAILLLLVIWMSHSLARLFWMLVPPPELAPAAIAVHQTSGTSGDSLAGVNILDLKSLELFGQAQSVDQVAENLPPPIEEADAAVDTQLNLQLLGVIASSAEDAGRAIIAANGQQDVYAPGAELPVGRSVTLNRVLDQRVILNNNGRLESLWLHDEGSDPGNRRSRAVNRYTAPVPEPMTSRSWSEESEAVQMDDQPPPQYVDNGPQPDSVQGSEADAVAEIGRNISDVVAMSIHREGGQVVGYKIRPGRNAEQFAALGLQPDDIVTAVNGVPLNNPGKIMEIYRNMSNATSASLEIKRGGSVMSVDIVLQ